jgi:hypothetical protein
MPKLVRKDADLNHGRPVTSQAGLDHIVVDSDKPSAGPRVVRRVGTTLPAAVEKPMGPYVARSALAAAFRLHERHEVDESIVVSRVRDPIRAVVVELCEIDGSVVQIQRVFKKIAQL